MDFRQTVQPNSGRPTAVNPAPGTSERKEEKGSAKKKGWSWYRLFNGVMLVGIALLIAATAIAITRGGSNEQKYVNTKQYQAVFLNNGQVYFGYVLSLNSQYVRMANIYYLTQADSGTSSTTASNNYSLVKLGCQQIHAPTDQMVINRDQVTFWENLSNDGKVVQSIKQFQKQNPNGPDCSQVSNETQASGNSTQNSQNSTNGTGTNGSNNSSSSNTTTDSSTNSTKK